MGPMEKDPEVGMELILLWLVAKQPSWVQEVGGGDGKKTQYVVLLPPRSKLCLPGPLVMRFNGESIKCLNPIVETMSGGSHVVLEEGGTEIPLNKFAPRLRAKVLSLGVATPKPTPKQPKTKGEKKQNPPGVRRPWSFS